MKSGHCHITRRLPEKKIIEPVVICFSAASQAHEHPATAIAGERNLLTFGRRQRIIGCNNQGPDGPRYCSKPINVRTANPDEPV